MLRGVLRLSVGLAMAFVLLSGVQAWAVDHWVRIPNSPCGVNHTSIQQAINHASNNDTIRVGQGIYKERLTISKNTLFIYAYYGPNQTFIRPPELVPAGIYITGNGNIFMDFTVQDVTPNTTMHRHAHRLIFVQGDNNLVTGCILRGRGIVSYADCGLLARGGGVGNGVAEGNTFNSNEVFNTVNGILSVSVAANNAASGTDVTSNYVHDCSQGIYIDRSPNCFVNGNVVVSNGLGIGVRSRQQTQGLNSDGTVVSSNFVSGNVVGALFVSCANVTVGGSSLAEANDITVNDIGVLVDYDSTNTGVPTVNYNRINGNGVGLRNNATETVNAENNWWGDPGGPGADANGDGVFGDTVEGNVDYDPWLTSP